MTPDDFEQIRSYTPADVERTGAKLGDVRLGTMRALDLFCFLTGVHWVILRNGLTTGAHTSIYHPRGEAVDVYPESLDGLNIRVCTDWAVVAGFRGRGVYWNGKWYSMHLDTRYVPGSWVRWRHGNEPGRWHEGALLVDPREVEYEHRGPRAATRG